MRIRKGWYAAPELPRLMQQVARVGGRATELTAAEYNGVWVPPYRGLHVALAPNACRPRHRTNFTIRLSAVVSTDVVVHWSDTGCGGTRFVVRPEDWLAETLRRRPLRFGFAVANSALRQGVVDRAGWERVRLSLSSERSRALASASPLPQSGTEAVALFLMLEAGIPVRAQVQLADDIWADLLVGERLAVEIDSRRYHTGEKAEGRDLVRENRLHRLGYNIVRFDYAQVMFQPHLVARTILCKMADCDHMRSKRP